MMSRSHLIEPVNIFCVNSRRCIDPEIYICVHRDHVPRKRRAHESGYITPRPGGTPVGGMNTPSTPIGDAKAAFGRTGNANILVFDVNEQRRSCLGLEMYGADSGRLLLLFDP